MNLQGGIKSMSPSPGNKMVLVFALGKFLSEATGDEPSTPDDLLLEGIPNITDFDIKTIQVLETAMDGSTLLDDIKLNFADILPVTKELVIYDVAEGVKYSVDMEITEEEEI